MAWLVSYKHCSQSHNSQEAEAAATLPGDIDSHCNDDDRVILLYERQWWPEDNNGRCSTVGDLSIREAMLLSLLDFWIRLPLLLSMTNTCPTVRSLSNYSGSWIRRSLIEEVQTTSKHLLSEFMESKQCRFLHFHDNPRSRIS